VGSGDLGAGPDQDIAPLIDRQALALDEFVLQIFQGGGVELELSLESAVGQASTPLQQGYRLVEDLLKGHRHSSLRRCGVQKTVWEWHRPCGRSYTAHG
jgi:hypothetical protein